MWLIIIGIILLIITTLELREKSTEAGSLFDYINPLDFFDIHKSTTPTLFWIVIIIQYCVAISIIIAGLREF
ncbi:hypothetical protein [Spartinivicinus ruber]|uniref:hypothetical protein n=1 Tax=Spartinivicinus ruber TaxID=2683272 RepID=UPI0013D3D154|nr:hypothetical protein [Spartinivicinus ruber]